MTRAGILQQKAGGINAVVKPSPLIELKVANERFIKAINSLDAAVMASMIHAQAINFMRDSAFSNEVPEGVSQATYCAIVRNGFENLESMQETPVDLKYKVVGNTGIVWGYNTIVSRFKGGQVQTKQSRITTTWVKSGGKWLVLCAHLSAIPSGD